MSDRPDDARSARGRAAHARGLRAETIAAWWLRLKGYRVIARRFRCKAGEIDLVVRKGALVAAVEVKSHADPEAEAGAIGRRQRGRIARAFAWFIAGRPDLAACAQRFDAVLVGRLPPRHIPDAWRPGLD